MLWQQSQKNSDLKQRSLFLANADSAVDCCPLCQNPLTHVARVWKTGSWLEKRTVPHTEGCDSRYYGATPVTSTHVSPARTSRKDTFNWGEGQGMWKKYENKFGERIIMLLHEGIQKKARGILGSWKWHSFLISP